MAAATAAPRFGPLLRLALESVGLRYVSVDLLRKAKRDSLSPRETLELWKALHDLVMLVLADFDVDYVEFERLNTSQELEQSLADPEAHRVRVELVRFYMHQWGFLCGALYAPRVDPPGQVLLLAFAWLVAYSKLLERRHQVIVEKYLGITHAHLPPFINDVVLDGQSVADAVVEATQELGDPQRGSQTAVNSFEDQLHQLHMAHGRLQHSVSELLAAHRYHQRLLLRLERRQGKSMAAGARNGGSKLEEADKPLPASVLQLLAQPKDKLDAQIRVVACSLQLLDDEILFYKWVNGVVASLATSSSSGADGDSVDALHTRYPTLEESRQTVNALLQAETYRELSQSFTTAWHKWKQQVKSSRSRVEQMEAKMEAITLQIRRSELIDLQKLFLLRPGQETSRPRSKGKSQSPEGLDKELKRLESQLDRVLNEITSEYCHLSLQ